ncbi:hypothetical protein E4U59_000198, partial [Claviceps monticola]
RTSSASRMFKLVTGADSGALQRFGEMFFSRGTVTRYGEDLVGGVSDSFVHGGTLGLVMGVGSNLDVRIAGRVLVKEGRPNLCSGIGMSAWASDEEAEGAAASLEGQAEAEAASEQGNIARAAREEHAGSSSHTSTGFVTPSSWGRKLPKSHLIQPALDIAFFLNDSYQRDRDLQSPYYCDLHSSLNKEVVEHPTDWVAD